MNNLWHIEQFGGIAEEKLSMHSNHSWEVLRNVFFTHFGQ